jgi:hypothetical protein
VANEHAIELHVEAGLEQIRFLGVSVRALTDQSNYFREGSENVMRMQTSLSRPLDVGDFF